MFFGREQETRPLVELLQPTLQRGPGRFVAVVGPSGSGKSSLLRAGLLPRLARRPERWVVLPPLLVRASSPPQPWPAAWPGPSPTAVSPRPAEELSAAWSGAPTGLVELAGELAELAGNGAGRPSVLVVIDQAEELITRTGAREQQASCTC